MSIQEPGYFLLSFGMYMYTQYKYIFFDSSQYQSYIILIETPIFHHMKLRTIQKGFLILIAI